MPPTSAGIQKEIMTHGPVVSCFEQYDDFNSYKSGVYVVSLLFNIVKIKKCSTPPELMLDFTVFVFLAGEHKMELPTGSSPTLGDTILENMAYFFNCLK